MSDTGTLVESSSGNVSSDREDAVGRGHPREENGPLEVAYQIPSLVPRIDRLVPPNAKLERMADEFGWVE